MLRLWVSAKMEANYTLKRSTTRRYRNTKVIDPIGPDGRRAYVIRVDGFHGTLTRRMTQEEATMFVKESRGLVIQDVSEVVALGDKQLDNYIQGARNTNNMGDAMVDYAKHSLRGLFTGKNK